MEQSQNQSLNDLQANLRNAEGGGDPTLQFFHDNWKTFIGLAFVVLAGVWTWDELKASQRESAEIGSDKFAALQESYEKSTSTENTEEEAAEAEDVDVLSTISGPIKELEGTNYEAFASLYKAQSLVKAGDYDSALKAIDLTHADKFSKIKAVSLPSVNVSPQNFVTELTALVAARIYLLSSEASKGREVLEGLAFGADFLNVEALSALLNSSNEPEDIKRAKEVASEVSGARPSLNDIISNRLGL